MKRSQCVPSLKDQLHSHNPMGELERINLMFVFHGTLLSSCSFNAVLSWLLSAATGRLQRWIKSLPLHSTKTRLVVSVCGKNLLSNGLAEEQERHTHAIHHLFPAATLLQHTFDAHELNFLCQLREEKKTVVLPFGNPLCSRWSCS